MIAYIAQELAGEGNYDAMKAAVMEVVGGHFRPEFVNRIDDIVVFHPLGKGQIRAITDIQLESLRLRLADIDLKIEVSIPALDVIGEAGFDPVYGARPLKRVIQQRLENPLAQRILKGEFHPGSTIHVELEDGELNFH